jgi:hypothetical protein
MGGLRRLILSTVCAAFWGVPALATWQPPPGYVPSKAVKLWFKEHDICCLKAERVRTKFKHSPDGNWEYRDRGAWLPIPRWITYSEGVVPPKGHENDPTFTKDLQFQQLRAEGVLFVFGGGPECFFPPKSGG